MNKDTQSKIEFFFFRLFLHIFRVFPFSLVLKILSYVFILGGYFIGIRKKVAKTQMKMVFPEKPSKEINKTLFRMYYDMGRVAAETYFGDSKKLFQQAEIKGWENLEKAVEMGKGVILVTGHIGNWELAGRYIASKFKLSVIFKKQRNRYFDEYTNKIREAENVVLIDKKNAFKSVLKMIKENYVVTILIDQNAGRDGILTDFLGHKASTFIGAAKIAIKVGCPIVPAFGIRKEDGTNSFFVEKMISPDNFNNDDRSIKELTEIISKKLEAYILKYPSQWFWVHKRWKGKDKAKRI